LAVFPSLFHFSSGSQSIVIQRGVADVVVVAIVVAEGDAAVALTGVDESLTGWA
jgi:hypothetical protein